MNLSIQLIGRITIMRNMHNDTTWVLMRSADSRINSLSGMTFLCKHYQRKYAAAAKATV